MPYKLHTSKCQSIFKKRPLEHLYDIESMEKCCYRDYDADYDDHSKWEIGSDELILPKARRKKFGYPKKKEAPSRKVEHKHVEPEDILSVDDRKEYIKQKLQAGLDVFTPKEELEIHERAELFCMTVRPDKNFYVLTAPQHNFHSKNDPIFVPTLRNKQHPKKGRRRSSLTDSCYLMHHSRNDPYDNSKCLPQGTKLLRPPEKLVEMVIKTIDHSPDVLLQVPQIYAVLQNRYPYFRYMDKSALSSWRSSIRHALYQKWFRKIRFSTQAINVKGCYWTINPDIDPRDWQLPDLRKKKDKKTTSSGHKQVESDAKDEAKPEDFDLDPNTHEEVFALLTQEEQEEFDSFDDSTSDDIQTDFHAAYYVKSSNEQLTPSVSLNDDSMEITLQQMPDKEKDPILSATTWSISSRNGKGNRATRDKQLGILQAPQHVHPYLSTKSCIRDTTDLFYSQDQNSILDQLITSGQNNDHHGLNSRLYSDDLSTWENDDDFQIETIDSDCLLSPQISFSNIGLYSAESLQSSPMSYGGHSDEKVGSFKFFSQNDDFTGNLNSVYDDDCFGNFDLIQGGIESTECVDDLSFASTESSSSE